MTDYEGQKRRAAEEAVRFVKDGMTLGLGTGSTAAHVLRRLGERIRQEGLRVRAVPSSERSRKLAEEEGIPLVTFAEVQRLDLTIDGADEVDPAFRMIKGGGGALLRERVVAAASEQVVIACDARKKVARLGAFPLPVEVVPFAWPLVQAQLAKEGGRLELRRDAAGQPFLTDGHHVILDWHLGEIADPEALSKRIRRLPGVVDHGLFLGYPNFVLFGHEEGVETLAATPGDRLL